MTETSEPVPDHQDAGVWVQVQVQVQVKSRNPGEPGIQNVRNQVSSGARQDLDCRPNARCDASHVDGNRAENWSVCEGSGVQVEHCTPLEGAA